MTSSYDTLIEEYLQPPEPNKRDEVDELIQRIKAEVYGTAVERCVVSLEEIKRVIVEPNRGRASVARMMDKLGTTSAAERFMDKLSECNIRVFSCSGGVVTFGWSKGRRNSHVEKGTGLGETGAEQQFYSQVGRWLFSAARTGGKIRRIGGY